MKDKDGNEIKEVTPGEVIEAVKELREKTEKYGADHAETKEMVDKIETTLVASEEQHKEVMTKHNEATKKALELEERVKDFELELIKSANAKANYKDLPEYKALEKMAKMGSDKLDIDEQKTLRMDTGTAGGYLTTTEMDSQIIKTITELSPVRQVARVKSTTQKTLEIPKRTGIPTATYEGEAAAGSDSESVYGNEQLTSYRLTVTVPFTMDLLNDSQFSLENEINNDVAEAMAFKEGNKFVLGTGSKQPEGFLVNAAIIADTATSETSQTITGDDLLLLTGELKVGYNPMYAFNRKTLAFLRTLKGSDGHYLWQASLAPNVPNTIGGENYIQFQDMPDIAASSKSIIYGDFLRGYCITDRTGMVVIRDDLAKKRQAIVELTFHKWNTGQVVLSEAFKLLTTQA